MIAVEASPPERKRLSKRHLRINHCSNVTVDEHALGEEVGTVRRWIVRGPQSGCNSLRQPNVDEPTDRVSVLVEPLDHMIQEHKIDRVDFIKIRTLKAPNFPSSKVLKHF